MVAIIISCICFSLVAIPTTVLLRNLQYFKPLPTIVPLNPTPVSVLIPARNEEDRIAVTLEALLLSEGVVFEVVVLNDASDDGTASVVQSFADRDFRVRLIQGNPLPAGWNGKQFACWQLSQHACHDRFVFLDADAAVMPDALLRLSAWMDCQSSVAKHPTKLLSAFPHQQVECLLETALVPLMHFVLLGFLPFWRMRRSTHPSYAAGCGQLFVTDRTDYQAVGGHAAIPDSRHDGIKLPKAYRRHNRMTDVVDGTDLATVRMYRSNRATWYGVMKNADEGLARPAFLLPTTMFCLAPATSLVLAVIFICTANYRAAGIGLIAFLVSFAPRFLTARRFRQPALSAVMHAESLLLFLLIQWIAFIRKRLGKPVLWRGRT